MAQNEPKQRDPKTEHEIIQEMEEIYSKIIQNSVHLRDNQEEFLEYVKKNYGDLFHVYYFPIRTMTFYGLWNKSLFKKYINEISKLGINITLKDQIPANANYLSEMIKIRDSLSGSKYRKLRKEVRKELEEEYNSFEDTIKDAEKEFDEVEEQNKKERIEETKDFLFKLAKATQNKEIL